MTRVLLSLAVLAFFALCLYGMWHGWQRRKPRKRRSSLPPIMLNAAPPTCSAWRWRISGVR